MDYKAALNEEKQITSVIRVEDHAILVGASTHSDMDATVP